MSQFKGLLRFCCAIGLSLGLMFGWGINAAIASEQFDPLDRPVIEWLKFAVPEAEQALFIAKEREIWDPLDRRSPAFVRKEIWQDPDSADNLIVVVYWSNQRQRKILDPATVKAAEQAFDQAVGKSYPILEKQEFLDLS